MTTVEITYVGGPTAVIGFAGLRLLTDPTFDAPGDVGARKLIAGQALTGPPLTR